jgi:hypothetical protein
MTGRGGSANGGFHEELRWEKVPDGAQRSRSTQTPGYERDLLRDRSGNLLGPTESRPANLEEALRSRGQAAPRADLRQQVAEAAIDAAITALTPYVKRAVEYALDRSEDGVKQLVSWAKRKAAERKPPAELAEADETAEVVEAEIVDDDATPGEDLEQATPPMTGEEYRARFLAALAAERYAAEEKRRLANVNVADDALSPELRAALRTALERPASLLDDETLAVVVEFLDGSRTGDGQYLLLDDDGSEHPRRQLDAGDSQSLS